MAITYPLSLPTNKAPSRVTFSVNTTVSISRSPFSYASQVQEFTGQLWQAEITLPIMAREDAEEWISFLLKLNGQQGTFLLGDPAAKIPRGVATGTPLVNGTGQTGQSLITDGWTNSVTGILKAGDYIQIGQRLYKNLSDANSNGSGQTTLDIWPRLRESPANNATIITANCVGLFRLKSSSYQVHAADVAKNFAVAFSAEEAV